jgi:branched-chain amino acid aminotransferase
VNDGEIYTPGLSESILDGITRDTLITLAEDRGYEVHDNVSMSRGELNTADELFFTGSAAEVTPIRQVDNVTIGNGSRGPVTEELQQAFFDLVERRTDEHDEWFTYVDVDD